MQLSVDHWKGGEHTEMYQIDIKIIFLLN